jgi:hypothetical protein
MMKLNHSAPDMTQVNRIIKWASKIGCHCDYNRASTGIIYISVSAPCRCHEILGDDFCHFCSNDYRDLKIRVGDHADAYATANYTADGCEGTIEGAIIYIYRHFGFEPPSRIINKPRVDAKGQRI